MFDRDRFSPTAWATLVGAVAALVVAGVMIYRSVRGPSPARIDPEFSPSWGRKRGSAQAVDAPERGRPDATGKQGAAL
jgi:hypothetical protein